VIIVSIEGMASSLTGPYGANTAMTPTLNSIAAHGIVLDQCFLDSCSLTEMFSSLWSGQHSLQLNRSNGISLWQLAQDQGTDCLLITDCPQTAVHAEQCGCHQAVLVEIAEALEPAQDSTHCCVMNLFTEAATLIEELQREPEGRPLLVWIHSRGFKLPWDAPIALRQKFADPQDPAPPCQVEPPSAEVTADTDPDWTLGWGQVAAAQMAVIDQAIELLHDYLSESEEFWAWCVLGLGGVPLGDHGWLGWGKTLLHGEQLQVPVLIVPNPPLPVGARRSELCQLPDMAATIAELSGLHWPHPVWGIGQLDLQGSDIPINWQSTLQTIGLVHGDQSWIRVPAWSLTFGSEDSQQLYVKPEDRWEVSEVSVRCIDVVAEMRELAAVFFRNAREGTRCELPALSDSLCNLLR